MVVVGSACAAGILAAGHWRGEGEGEGGRARVEGRGLAVRLFDERARTVAKPGWSVVGRARRWLSLVAGWQERGEWGRARERREEDDEEEEMRPCLVTRSAGRSKAELIRATTCWAHPRPTRTSAQQAEP